MLILGWRVQKTVDYSAFWGLYLMYCISFPHGWSSGRWTSRSCDFQIYFCYNSQQTHDCLEKVLWDRFLNQLGWSAGHPPSVDGLLWLTQLQWCVSRGRRHWAELKQCRERHTVCVRERRAVTLQVADKVSVSSQWYSRVSGVGGRLSVCVCV